MTKPTPEEMLAAWAHRPGDLTADERRAVEALVARSPAAAHEADEARRAIARMAELPAVGTEPSWSDLERSIRAACDEAPPGRWARWVDAFRGWKPAAALGGGLLVAIAAFALWIGRGSSELARPATLAATDELGAVEQAIASLQSQSAGAMATEPAGSDLDENEIALETEADTDAMLAEWGAMAPDSGLLGDLDLAGLTWPEWVDELEDSELDAVSQWLDTQESG